VVALGLARGPAAGAVFGFAGGFVVDLVTLDTLGITSLVLTLAGFLAGRYGDTGGRDRRLAPLVAVGAIAVLAAGFGFVLHYLLGEEVVARQALVNALLPALAWNLVLALPVRALVRRVVGDGEPVEPSPEVEVLA
jgi:rod shape-determining protein MreD